jgi:hypothetical protein
MSKKATGEERAGQIPKRHTSELTQTALDAPPPQVTIWSELMVIMVEALGILQGRKKQRPSTKKRFSFLFLALAAPFFAFFVFSLSFVCGPGIWLSTRGYSQLKSSLGI